VGIAYQRGMLLYNQKRYSMAADEFRKELVQNPDSGHAKGMLALSLNYDNKPKEAIETAKDAIGTDPENGFVHYVMAVITVGSKGRGRWMRYLGILGLMSRRYTYERRLFKARKFITEAIRLNPHNVEFLAMMSAIQLDLHRPKQSLEWAEKGLAIRADHVRCTNLRARALAAIGRHKEARETVRGALALDPESAATHSSSGWTHLKVGDPQEAVQHFSEAVRLNPNDKDAHKGLRAARLSARRFKSNLLTIIISISLICVANNAFHGDPYAPYILASVLGLLILVFIGRRIRRRNIR
jgi:tetratricopeptide (TPR) repeat protein